MFAPFVCLLTGAGYGHGWGRPDGSIILTNNSPSDPAVGLQQMLGADGKRVAC